MKLDFDSLYSVSREEFQRDFDAILEKVEKGAGPILITDQGLPDLLLFGWEDYWQRFGSLYEPGDREKIEAEIKRKYKAEQVQPTGPIIDATPTK